MTFGKAMNHLRYWTSQVNKKDKDATVLTVTGATKQYEDQMLVKQHTHTHTRFPQGRSINARHIKNMGVHGATMGLCGKKQNKKTSCMLSWYPLKYPLCLVIPGSTTQYQALNLGWTKTQLFIFLCYCFLWLYCFDALVILPCIKCLWVLRKALLNKKCAIISILIYSAYSQTNFPLQ